MRSLTTCSAAVAIAIAFVVIGTATISNATEQTRMQFGTYDGEISATWQNDRAGRSMRIDRAVSFTDPKKAVWHVPIGAIVDGASIPQKLQPFVGTPFVGKYRRATVFHDFYCDTKLRKWKDVHEMFYYAMRADGVSKVQAVIMWAAVRYFGPRWRGLSKTGECIDSCDEAGPKTPTVNADWFKRYVDWVNRDEWKQNFDSHQLVAEICDHPNSSDVLSSLSFTTFGPGMREFWVSMERRYPNAHSKSSRAWMLQDFAITTGCPPRTSSGR